MSIQSKSYDLGIFKYSVTELTTRLLDKIKDGIKLFTATKGDKPQYWAQKSLVFYVYVYVGYLCDLRRILTSVFFNSQNSHYYEKRGCEPHVL